MNTFIVVAAHGFVWVAKMQDFNTYDGFYTLHKARQVRIWGTSSGLNELINGPTADTKLDAAGDVFLHQQAMVSIIPVNNAAWAKHIS